MKSINLIHSEVDQMSNPELRKLQQRETLQPEEVEARIQRLSDRFEILNSPANLVWFKSEPYLHDPDLDLCVKVEAVRWMLRIAKHTGEPAREVIFRRIENSLTQLEEAVESGLRAAEAISDSGPRHRVAHA